MDSVSYQKILEANLLPFVREKFPNGFRLYQVHIVQSLCFCIKYGKVCWQPVVIIKKVW